MPKRPRVLNVLAALLALTFLLPPTLATARPLHTETSTRPAERTEATPGLLAQLRDLLSVLWAENGSGLEPDGTVTTASGTDGDNGSILEPDGRR